MDSYHEEYIFPNHGRAHIDIDIVNGVPYYGHVLFRDKKGVGLDFAQGTNLRSLRCALEGFIWGISMSSNIPLNVSREEGWSEEYYQGMGPKRPSDRSVMKQLRGS